MSESASVGSISWSPFSILRPVGVRRRFGPETAEIPKQTLADNNESVLVTRRLLLRRFTHRDVDAYAALVGDAEVMRFVGTGRPATISEAANAISRINARFEEDGFGVLGVERRADGRLIGRVGFWVWDRTDWTPGHTKHELGEQGEVELGWLLLRDAWGHGYATEAAAALRDDAFQRLGLRRLISLIHPSNGRSLRVAQRLGAVHESDVETARWGPALLFAHVVPPGRAPYRGSTHRESRA
jgi:RimJ/RimL family protein N-acetyltransferase